MNNRAKNEPPRQRTFAEQPLSLIKPVVLSAILSTVLISCFPLLNPVDPLSSNYDGSRAEREDGIGGGVSEEDGTVPLDEPQGEELDEPEGEEPEVPEEEPPTVPSIVVAGSVFNGSDWDIYLAEYDAGDYSLLQETSIDFNSGGMDDEVTSLDIDADGNIYVAGYTWDGADTLTRDVFLVKFDPSFTQINSTQFPSNGGSVASMEDTINAIAVGDYVYATGKTNRNGPDGDRLLVRTNLDFSGTINDNWDPGLSDLALGNTLSLTAAGKLTVGGMTDQGSWTWDLSIRSNDLFEDHQITLGGDPGSPIGSAVDSEGNVYFVGWKNPSTSRDWYVIKFDSTLKQDAGFAPFSNDYNGYDDTARAAVVDEGNNVLYVVGTSKLSFNEWTVEALDTTDGTQIGGTSLYTYPSANGDVFAFDAVLLPDGELFIVGTDITASGDTVSRIAVIDSAGTELAVFTDDQSQFPQSKLAAAVIR